jgi:hypothetical protein
MQSWTPVLHAQKLSRTLEHQRASHKTIRIPTTTNPALQDADTLKHFKPIDQIFRRLVTATMRCTVLPPTILGQLMVKP